MRNESTDFKYFVPKCRIQSNSRLIIFIFRVGIWNGLMNRSVIGFFGKMSSQISLSGRLSQISVPLFWRLLSSNAILFESAILSSVLWLTPSALVPLLIIAGYLSRLDLRKTNTHTLTKAKQTRVSKANTVPFKWFALLPASSPARPPKCWPNRDESKLKLALEKRRWF